MKIVPSKTQWDAWTLPSKAGYVSCVIGIICLAIAVVPLFCRNKFDPDKISLGIRYAYEYDNYLGATNTLGNEDRKIESNQPLKKKYNPDENISFVFAIINENRGLPFEDVYLEVILPEKVKDVAFGQGWQVQNIKKRYTYHFNRINNVPLNTFSAISIKFLEPGEYIIQCTINGKGISRSIEVPVKLILYS